MRAARAQTLEDAIGEFKRLLTLHNEDAIKFIAIGLAIMRCAHKIIRPIGGNRDDLRTARHALHIFIIGAAAEQIATNASRREQARHELNVEIIRLAKIFIQLALRGIRLGEKIFHLFGCDAAGDNRALSEQLLPAGELKAFQI